MVKKLTFEQAKSLALRLALGETIDRKEFGSDKGFTEYNLREIKNNCNRVLRQLKNF